MNSQNSEETELASIVGARREVVARSLKDFEEHGAIERDHGHIMVKDSTKLHDLKTHGQR